MRRRESDAAAGIDAETWEHYGEALKGHLQDLAERREAGGAYRASRSGGCPSRRRMGGCARSGFPRWDGEVVQHAVVAVPGADAPTETPA
jgi:hypothetical protein